MIAPNKLCADEGKIEKRSLRLVVSGLMVLFLVLGACARAVPEEKEEKVVAPKEEVVAPKKEVGAPKKEEGAPEVALLPYQKDVPQYGGTLTLVVSAENMKGFNRGLVNTIAYSEWYNDLMSDVLVGRDRTKGPGGTREWMAPASATDIGEHRMLGMMAESFQLTPPDTIKYKIRRGIHWENKWPTYGREFTAEDALFIFRNRYGTPGNPARDSWVTLADLKNVENAIYIDPDDPWTIVFKAIPGRVGLMWEVHQFQTLYVPKELEATGDEYFGTWRGTVSNGPFLWTDYVMGSSLTFKRNPNYWMKDQLHPENQLPYVDTLQVLVIPDSSTRYAALRTGKIDQLVDLPWEDFENLRQTVGGLKWVEFLKPTPGDSLAMRNDVAPWSDVRVRRAAMMAINQPEILKSYYGGRGAVFYDPAFPIPEHADMYIPLEEMPRSVQELFEYHPDKAKQLLAEAGYPNGFKTSVAVSSVDEGAIDKVSMVKAYWEKVGINLEIELKEPAAFVNMERTKTYTQGITAVLTVTEPYFWNRRKAGNVLNYAMVNDPLIEKNYDRLLATTHVNRVEQARITKELSAPINDAAHYIKLPLSNYYNVWQPWLESYYGEYEAEFLAGPTSIAKYVWINQELRQEMTGR